MLAGVLLRSVNILFISFSDITILIQLHVKMKPTLIHQSKSWTFSSSANASLLLLIVRTSSLSYCSPSIQSHILMGNLLCIHIYANESL